MTSHNKMITYIWSFSFGFFSIYNILSFLNKTSHFELVPKIFDISILRVFLWLFGHHTFQYKSFSLFLSQILICVTTFAAYYLFLFWDLYWLSSLSKNIKSVGRYIGISLCIYQNYQDYWSIIHDKFEDRFTIVTHRFQDFSPKDRCAYKTS